MTYYHATYAKRIESIQKHGLRPVEDRNFPDAEPGLYLSTDPWIAISVLIEHGLEPILEGKVEPTGSPKELVESFRVIVVDRSRVREELLRPDPQVEGSTVEGMWWVYPGTVDVSGMPVLNMDQLGAPPGE